jgi:hypothetical protein
VSVKEDNIVVFVEHCTRRLEITARQTPERMEVINSSDHLCEIAARTQFWDRTPGLHKVKKIAQFWILKNENKALGEVKYVEEFPKVRVIDLAKEIDFAGEAREVLFREDT